MSAETPTAPLPTGAPNHALVGLARFVRLVRHRLSLVYLALGVSGALGALFYSVTERLYESRASLYIQQPEARSITIDGATVQRTDPMPTYQRLVTSERVLGPALLQLTESEKVDLAGVPKGKWVDALAARLSVKAVRKTNILEISFKSKKPAAAAAVVNAVLSSYRAFMNQTHEQTALEVLKVLKAEKDALEGTLADRELELAEARRLNGDLGLDGSDRHTNLVVARMDALNKELFEAQKRRLQAESELASLEAAIRNGDDLLQHALVTADAVGREYLLQALGMSQQDNYTVLHVNRQMINDAAELRRALQFYGPAHPKVRELSDKIQGAEQFLADRSRQVSERFRQMQGGDLGMMLHQMAKQKYAQAVEHEERLAEDFELERQNALDLTSGMARVQMLEMDVARLRRSYDTTLERIRAIDLSKEDGNIRAIIVSDPHVPTVPVWPQLKLVVLAFLALGLGSGLAVVYILDVLDDRFRSPEELRTQLGVQVLAMVRELQPIPGAGIETLHVHSRPNGVESEAFRTLRTAVGFLDGETQRLVMSSAEPGDGKTTVAANLALAYAQSGKKTLLIDADMRRPGSTNLFQLRGMSGLSTLLRSQGPVAKEVLDHLQHVGADLLDFLPSGPRPANPAELLSGERMQELLAWAETVYDQIIVDAPPTLACSDAILIGRIVDGVLLVVRPDKNRRRMVIRAVESFSSMGVRMFGVVLNHLSAHSSEEYYGYGYGYGYGEGYGHDETDEENAAGKDEEPARDRAA